MKNTRKNRFPWQVYPAMYRGLEIDINDSQESAALCMRSVHQLSQQPTVSLAQAEADKILPWFLQVEQKT